MPLLLGKAASGLNFGIIGLTHHTIVAKKHRGRRKLRSRRIGILPVQTGWMRIAQEKEGFRESEKQLR
jgi:hypothetical protein